MVLGGSPPHGLVWLQWRTRGIALKRLTELIYLPGAPGLEEIQIAAADVALCMDVLLVHVLSSLRSQLQILLNLFL